MYSTSRKLSGNDLSMLLHCFAWRAGLVLDTCNLTPTLKGRLHLMITSRFHPMTKLSFRKMPLTTLHLWNPGTNSIHRVVIFVPCSFLPIVRHHVHAIQETRFAELCCKITTKSGHTVAPEKMMPPREHNCETST